MKEKLLEIKEPPQSLENEIQVLGSIILENKLIIDIIDSVSYATFFDKRNQDVFTAMLYLHYNNQPIDYTTLSNRLKYKINNDMIDYLIDLNKAVPSTTTFENRVEVLKDTYQKRVLYNLAKETLTKDISGIASLNMVKNIEKKIELMGISSNLELDSFSDYIDEWVVNLEDTTTIVQKYKMGYKLLDDIVLLEDSNLMLISARPSLGKSALALNLAKNFCKQNKHTLFVSLEMSKKEIMNRLVANMARVPAKKLKRKEPLTTVEWQNVMTAKNDIKKWNLNIYAKGSMYIEQLVGLAKHLKKKGKLDVLVVDYLQLLDSHSHNKNRVQQVSLISRKLKQIAMDLEIPVIALSQLSRAGVEQGGKPREPQLSDLRDSGK
jgi:replicative DNA helicase